MRSRDDDASTDGIPEVVVDELHNVCG